MMQVKLRKCPYKVQTPCMRRGAVLIRTSMSVWIVASLLLCRERVEGNEWTRASQAFVNLFKLVFFLRLMQVQKPR